MSPVVLCIGNPFDGLALIGPFPDADTAARYAEDFDDDWHTAPLAPPVETEPEAPITRGARATCRRCGDDIDAGDRFCSRQCKREHDTATGGERADLWFAHPGQYPIDNGTPDGTHLPSGWYHEGAVGPFPTREHAADSYRRLPTVQP